MTNWKGHSSLFGAFLLHLSMSLFYTIGNLNTYVTSYIRQNVDDHVTYSSGVWLSTAFVVTGGVTVALGGLLQRRIGSCWTSMIGSMIFSVFTALTFFGIKQSMALLVVCFSVVPAVGFGMTATILSANNAKWFPKHRGLVVCLAECGSGALILNPFITFYVNPDNKESEGDYFTDDKILAKVPSLFLVLAGFCFALQVVGILAVFEADKYIAKLENTVSKPDNLESNSKSTNLESNSKTESLESNATFVKNERTSTEDEDSEDNKNSDKFFPVEKSSDVLKLPIFYALWLTFAFGMAAFTFFNALYKSFGQSFIADDHFLALVGSISSVFNLGGKIMWGRLLDRFRVKWVLTALYGGLSILVFTFDLTTRMGRACYAVWVCLIFLGTSGIIPITFVVTVKKFGTQHSTLIYSLLFTGPTIFTVIGSVAIQGVLEQFGRFVSCTAVGGLYFGSLLVILFFFK